MTLLLLMVLGIVEAVVWLFRMRTAVGASAWVSGLSALAVTVTRIVFALASASVVLGEIAWWKAIVVYALPASVATVAVHALAERCKGQREAAARGPGPGTGGTPVPPAAPRGRA